MTEENESRTSPATSILSVLVLIFTIVEVVIFLFIGGSSVATEPNPIFGNLFPLVTILVIVVLGIIFFLGIEKVQKRNENVRRSNT
jgi:heme/copper-type cytochrome/quinol oxidase subunit 4